MLLNEWFSSSTLCDNLRFDLGFASMGSTASKNQYADCPEENDVDAAQAQKCVGILRRDGYNYLSNCTEAEEKETPYPRNERLEES